MVANDTIIALSAKLQYSKAKRFGHDHKARGGPSIGSIGFRRLERCLPYSIKELRINYSTFKVLKDMDCYRTGIAFFVNCIIKLKN